MLQKLVINKIISILAKNFKLFKVLEYVEKPNELDHKVVELENKILKLEKLQGKINKIEKRLKLFKK
tara:strand:- start:1190 stop:1390 length:201 start_codon:yes stop_codon:yes gene_type:complete